MNCMKCGREVDEGQVFCLDCLKEMAKYPVRPGTVVLLPKREEVHHVKKVQTKRRPNAAPEEQIRSLKIRLRIVTAMLIISLALMAAMVYPMAKEIFGPKMLRPGQNYNAIVTTEKIP